MKTIVKAGTAALVLASLALSGCSGGSAVDPGGSAAAGGEPVTITLWEGFAQGETTALQEMIAKYWDPQHPDITVKVEGEKTAQAMLTAMSGGDAPDVIMSTDSESPALWFENKAIMDLSDLASEIQTELDSDVVTAARQWGKQGDTTFALPFVDYNWGIFYNKQLFKDAGLDPESFPATIDGLESAAKQLTKVDADGNLIQLGWNPIHDEWTAIAMSMAFGAKFVDSNGQPTMNEPAINQALTWDSDLAKDIGLDKVEAFISGFTKGDNPFALGKVAIYIDGVWQAAMLKDSPDIDFGVAAIPGSEAANDMANNVGTNPIVIPSAAKHVAEAKEFAKFMALNADLAADFSNQIANIPHIKSVLTTFTDDPKIKFFADLSTSPNARAWAPVPYARLYADQLANAVGEIYINGAEVGATLEAGQAVVSAEASRF